MQSNPFTNIFNLIVALLTAILALFGASGCAPQDKNLELVMNKVSYVVDNILEDTDISTVQWSGSMQGVEPGYEGTFEGFWCTGIKGAVAIRLVGVGGQISGNAAGTSTQPAESTDDQ